MTYILSFMTYTCISFIPPVMKSIQCYDNRTQKSYKMFKHKNCFAPIWEIKMYKLTST